MYKVYIFLLSSIVFLNLVLIYEVLTIPEIDPGIRVYKIPPRVDPEIVIDIEEEVLGVDYDTNFIPGYYEYVSPIDERIPLSEEDQRTIQYICEKYDVDINLVYAICFRESGMDPSAVSSDGSCLGLMQISSRYHDMEDPFSVRDNVEAGCKYLRSLLDDYEDEARVLAIYHGEADAYTKTTPSSYTRGILERRNQLGAE